LDLQVHARDHGRVDNREDDVGLVTDVCECDRRDPIQVSNIILGIEVH
jgi:hypothetical protein